MTRTPTKAVVALLMLVAACTTERQVGRFVDPPPTGTGGAVVPDAAPLDSDGNDSGSPPVDAPIDGGAIEVPIDTIMPAVYFMRIPAGRPLPDEATCAAKVQRGGPEARADNAPFNTISPTDAQLSGLSAFGGNRGWDAAAIPLGKRVSGNFSGTTDEILRWAACKWGFDENFVRADAYQANGWHQASLSAWTSNRANCPADGPTRAGAGGTECAGVFGVFGISWQYHKSGWPMIHDSTAFNIDYALAVQRVCFEGYVGYMRGWGPPDKLYGPNDEFGCAAGWYTGGWYDYPTIQQVNRIRDTLAKEPWKNSP